MATLTIDTVKYHAYKILNNLGTLLLALILALIVWLTATNQENPTVTDIFPEEVQINIRGLDTGLGVVQNLASETVRPRIRAPQSAWEGLSEEDISAYIDLTGLAEGEHDVSVEVESLDPKITLLENQVQPFRITLDQVITKTLAARVDFIDSPASGYQLQSHVVEPITITVSGPKTYVDDVAFLETTISVLGEKRQVEKIGQLEPLSQSGDPITRVDLEPSRVNIIASIGPTPGMKEVAVRPKLEGAPDNGYRLSAVKVEPSTIILSGSKEEVDAVPGFVETVPLTLTNATETIQQSVQIVLPDGVESLNGDQVLVTASFAPLVGGMTVKRTPSHKSVGSGLDATVPIDMVDVILRGPILALEKLTDDDVQVVLDLEGLLPGVHIVEPDVNLPTGITKAGLLPETIEVIIADVGGPRPASLLPPTPTPVVILISPLETPER